MNPLQILALLEAGIKLFGVIQSAVDQAKPTLQADELAPLLAQLEILHGQSMALSAELSAAAADAARG